MSRALTVKGLRKEMAKAQGFNAKVAIVVTGWVSTMWCAYVFAIIAFLSLPAIMTEAFHLHIFPSWIITPSLISLVAWVSSYFLQLVLLSILSVQQDVEGVRASVIQQEIVSQVNLAADRLDTDTQGGITAILERIDALDQRLSFISISGSRITAGDLLEAKKNLPPGSARRRHI